MNTLEMPSSGIVLVDQNAEHNQHIQSSQHQQSQQQIHHQLGQTHQVLVGDELISAENIVTGGGCQYITTKDLLNNAQIIKFVSEEEVALIEQQQQLQHDEIYGQQHLIQTAPNPNSKVHVISNVTIVSKAQQNQQQQHTISFVNSKPMTGAAVTFVNTYLSTKMLPTTTTVGGGATGKVVNVPYKSGAQLSSPQQQQQSTSVVNHKHGIGALVQKVSVPRYMTRLPAMPNATSPNNSNLVIGRGGGIAPPINSVIQTHQVQKQPNIQTVSPSKVNHVRHNNKTSAVASSIKVMHGAANAAATLTTKLSGIKPIPAQHLPKGHTKSSKIIKHYNNSMPSSSIYNPQQQQQHQHQNHNKNNNFHVQQTTNNNINNTTNNTASNTTVTTKTMQQQQRPVYNNIYVQGPVQRGSKLNKYTVQQSVSTMSNLMINQQHQSTVLPQQQQPQHHLKLATGSHQYQSSVQSNMSGSGSGTIKYVNAQGNVIAAAPTRSRNIPQQRPQPMEHLQQSQQLMFSSELEPIPSPSTIASVDDMVMVNGTHMSEEMSARILQSLSQKSIYNNNNNSNINNRHCTTTGPLGNFAKQSVGQQAYLSSPNSDQQQQQQHPLQYMYRSGFSDTSEPNNKILHEYFKVNTCDIQSSSTTFIDNIPLISTRSDTTSLPGCGNTSAAYQPTAGGENEEDIIGEEVLPPLDTRLQLVYTFLQDHTYAAQDPQKTTPPVAAVLQSPDLLPVAQQLLQSSPLHRQSPQLQHQQQLHYQQSPSTPHKHHLQDHQSQLQAQLPSPPPPQQIQHHQQQQQRSLPVTDIIPVENTQNVISAGSNLNFAIFAGGTPAKPGPGFSYVYNPSADNDDDTHSVISNGRRSENQMDQGEETDTAPEGDNEDDSVTRCICDLTHDDGYMICCDKCSVWQHVDCMGIDRENIPDEYKCELCQPRPVERTRARALQLLKRKEQQNLLLLNSQALHAHQHQMPLPVDGLPLHIIAAQAGGLAAGAQKPITLPPNSKMAKQRQPTSTATGSSTSPKRKSDVPFTVKRKRGETASRANGKRREPKKVSKRKSASKTPSTTSSVATVEPVVDKQTANLRTWIENYELAMTNHYSPELRARLQAIGKQQQLHNQQHASPHLRHVSQLDGGKCTTVPHAGGKILISNLDLTPNHAVIEIRGKYMLSLQYKAQPTIPPTGNARSNIYSRNPGPFLFFYRLPNDGPEICVDTRTYGNEARFVRRSCRPNAEIQHTIEKGTIHLYIVSLAQIKSSTEITIKHEPHDLTSIQRSTINAPTSTMCACGLTKDCLFSVASTPSVTGSSTASTSGTSSMTAPSTVSKTRSNGNIVLHTESLGAIVQAPPPPIKPAYRRKNPSAANRNRSTSSSGDSNNGMLSPINNSSFTSVSVASLMNDSGVYMTSSSSSVSLPSPSLPSPSCQPMASLVSPQGSPLPFLAGPPLDTTMMQVPSRVIQVHDQPQLGQEFPPPPPPPVQGKMTYVMQQPLLSPLQPVVHVQQPPLLYPVMVTSIVQMSLTSTMTSVTAGGSPVVPIQSAVMTPLPLPESTNLSLTTLALQQSPIAPIQTTSPQFHNQTLMPHQTIEQPPSPVSFQSGESHQAAQHLPAILQQSPALQQLLVPMSPHLTRPTSLQLEEEPNTSEAIDSTQHSAKSTDHKTPTKVPAALRSPIPKTLGSGGKKTPRKSSCSLSEDSSSLVGDESAQSSKKDTPEPATSTTKKDGEGTSKKMTREERKMQAIVKAFEKMEKNQLRKQELKQKTPISAMTDTTQNPQHQQQQQQQPQRRRLNNIRSPLKQDIPASKKSSSSSSSSMRKKKRKGSKSYQQISNQRKRLRSRLNSGDSDMVTSEDSTSLLSPTLITPSGLQQANSAAVKNKSLPVSTYVSPNIQPSVDQDVTDGNDIGSAAGMLMSLSHCKPTDVDQNIEENDSHLHHLNSPIRLANRSLSEQPTPPFALSSACMFIEAAVGPCERTHTLDNEFKLPPKTKTKKTIMNDWLHQSEPSTSSYSPQQLEEQIPEHHLQQHVIYPNQPPNHHIIDGYSSIQPCQNEPQNLSMAAKRIEEFIHITSNDSVAPLNGDINKWHHSDALTNSPSPPLVLCDQQPPLHSVESTIVHTVPQSLPTPPMQCGSSVKKRWLRQAISEECSDDLSTPLNGYMTPLKKRRMARECSAAAAAAAAIDNCLPTSPHMIISYDQHKAISLADIIPMVNQPFMPQLGQQPYELMPAIGPGLFREPTPPVTVPTFIPENRLEYVPVATIEEPESIVHSQSSPTMPALGEFGEFQVKAKEENMKIKCYGSDRDEYTLHVTEPEEMKVEVAIIAEIFEKEVIEACKTEVAEEPVEYYVEEIREDDIVPPTVPDKRRCVQEEDEPCVTVVPPVIEITTVVDDSKPVVVDVEKTIAISLEEATEPTRIVEVSIPPQVELRPLIVSLPVAVETSPETSPIADEFDIKPLEECDIKKNDWSGEMGSEQNSHLDSPASTNTSVSIAFTTQATVVRPSVSLTNCDEIADIQQRLHSFHNENLMILASRNKKKHSRATTPTYEDGSSSASSQETVTLPLKRKRNKRLVFSDKNKEHPEVAKDDVLPPATADEPLLKSVPYKWLESGVTVPATCAAASTIPVFNQFSPYLLNSKSSSIPVSIAPCFGIVQPLPPPPPLQSVTTSSDAVTQLTAAQSLQLPTPPIHPPLNTIHSSFYSKFSAEFPDVVSTLSPLVGNNKSLLSDYLEHPKKPSSYSTLNFVSMLDPAPRQQHSMFAVSAPVVAGSFMISKSYSTLDPTTSAVLSPTMAATSATNPNGSGTGNCPKVLTRTQSADPRLNPSLSSPHPPPAPKRKLSINEYRKRKQQSSDGGLNKVRTHSKVIGSTVTETASNSGADSTSSGPSFFENGLTSSLLTKSTDEKETAVFSPAPTLLEMQQENLSQRLKNYKSLHCLTASAGAVTLATTTTNSIGSTSATSSHCDVKDYEIESILKFDSSEKLSGSYSNLLSMSSTSSATPVNTGSTSTSSSSSSCDFNDDHHQSHLLNHRLLHEDEILSPGESTSR